MLAQEFDVFLFGSGGPEPISLGLSLKWGKRLLSFTQKARGSYKRSVNPICLLLVGVNPYDFRTIREFPEKEGCELEGLNSCRKHGGQDEAQTSRL